MATSKRFIFVLPSKLTYILPNLSLILNLDVSSTTYVAPMNFLYSVLYQQIFVKSTHIYSNIQESDEGKI